MAEEIIINHDVMSYLKEKVSDFNPTEEEVTFINDKLKLNWNNNIQIGGFLLIQFIMLYIYLIGPVAVIINELDNGNILIILIATIILIFEIGLIYAVTNRKKYTKVLFVIYYFFAYLSSAFNIIPSVICTLYVLKSKRVKYTFIK